MWIISEFKAKTGVRLLLGIVAMITLAALSCQIALIKPASEKKYLHDSIGRIQELLRDGKAGKVEKAFQAYADEMSAGRGEYRAIQEMWGELNAR